MLTQRLERASQLQKNVDALLQGFRVLRKVPDSLAGLLEALDRLAVSVAPHRLDARPAQVSHSSLPLLAANRMVGKLLDMLADLISMELLDGVHDPGMQGTAMFL